jgi:hypothetical protein
LGTGWKKSDSVCLTLCGFGSSTQCVADKMQEYNYNKTIRASVNRRTLSAKARFLLSFLILREKAVCFLFL